jgi:hypothetical protein
MGKGARWGPTKGSPKRRSECAPAASGNPRILTTQALGDAIAKKQQIDTVKKVNDILKVKPHLACRVLHVLESGMFECDNNNVDFIPPSTNKFRLLSLNHCKEILLAIAPKGKKVGFSQELALIRVKREASQLLCFLARCNEGCALPSRSIPRLHQVVRDRASEVPGRWDRFEIASNAKGGKAEGNIVKFPRGVFEFTDYCEQESKYKKVLHIDSGIKADVWDEIVIKKGAAIIQNNWNEYAAFVKIRAEVYIMQMFQEEAGDDKASPEKKYRGVPQPLDNDVIPERHTSMEEAEVATGSACNSSKAPMTAVSEPRRRLRKANSSASDTTAVPDGWGGSMTPQ